MFTLLAADKIAQEGLDWIASQDDCKLVNRPDLVDMKKNDGQEAVDAEVGQLLAAGGVHAMIVRSGIKVTAAMLENPGDLKVIARAGVGVDNIDLHAATAKGILVVNTAAASTITTAEHAFTLMCALARNVGPAYKTMAEGGWDRNKFSGTQLAGKTLGIIGFGRIGQTIAKRAIAFDMDVVAYDPFINSPTMMDGQVRMFTDFKELLPHADVLTFHVPLNDQTRNMLGKETWHLCRKGVLVVNAARGGVVEEEAVIDAIESGQCGGVALDVFTSEPPAEDNPLRTHPKVLVTPHLGASTKEAQLAVSTDAGAACVSYLRGEGIKGAVNAGGVRVDLDPQQTAFVDLAERMAAMISPMVTRGISQIDIELHCKNLSPASGTIERTVLVNLLKDHIDEQLNVINVGAIANDRGIKTRVVVVEDEPLQQALMTLNIVGPPEAIDNATDTVDKTRRIVGRVYEDGRPRITEINGYHMDMIPAGEMCLIQNEDQPGVIGTVGGEFGNAKVNIADMSISRRETEQGTTALMVLKLDNEAPEALQESLRSSAGILKVATVTLPQEVEK